MMLYLIKLLFCMMLHALGVQKNSQSFSFTLQESKWLPADKVLPVFPNTLSGLLYD